MDQPPLNAETLANPGAMEHEVSAFGLTPGVFVALSMIVVLGILWWKKGFHAIGASLDKKIASVREQLEEASKLRAEAEAIKRDYEARASSAEGEARSIVEHAQAEAAAILAKAKSDAETLIARRGRMAEDKIAAAERQALVEVREKVAAVATAAAARLIADRHDAAADHALVDRAIGGLGQRG